ncbi:MAG: cytochrome c [Bdellovibrionales bacterium]|nr:cytochrome c [Bdellovibrionales bacterium]
MKSIGLILGGLFTFISLVSANDEIKAEDVSRGLQLSAQCVQCHGANGITNHGMHPNLAGQNYVYLVRQLMAFKSDSRIGHHMNDVAKGLTEEDIKDLAAYYSQINICE